MFSRCSVISSTTNHVRIFVRIWNTDLSQFDVEVLNSSKERMIRNN